MSQKTLAIIGVIAAIVIGAVVVASTYVLGGGDIGLAASSPDFATAEALYHQGRPEAALIHYEKALGQNPGNPEILNGMGISYLAMGRYDDAIVHLEEAYVAEPDDLVITYNLAVSLAEAGWYLDAHDILDRGLAIDPTNYMLLEYKSLLYTGNGEHEVALPYYDRALAVQESHFLMLGKAYSLFQLDQDRAAYTYIDRVLAADPSNELAIYMREAAGFEMLLEGLLAD